LKSSPRSGFALPAAEAGRYRIEMETISDAVAAIFDPEFGTPNATHQMVANDAVRRSIVFGIRCYGDRNVLEVNAFRVQTATFPTVHV
jgi:hypothetical protein